MMLNFKKYFTTSNYLIDDYFPIYAATSNLCDILAFFIRKYDQHHRDRRTRELARSRDTGQQSKFKMVA